MAHALKFTRIAGAFAVCRLPARSSVPLWALQGAFFAVTSTAEELSVVCPSTQVPADVQHDSGWTCFQLIGPFPFETTGILASFIQPLAEWAIPIFAISTFDTDYVLVRDGWVEKTLDALRDAGHVLI